MKSILQSPSTAGLGGKRSWQPDGATTEDNRRPPKRQTESEGSTTDNQAIPLRFPPSAELVTGHGSSHKNEDVELPDKRNNTPAVDKIHTEKQKLLNRANTAQAKPSALLNLPAELRNRIWRYAVRGVVHIDKQRPLVRIPALAQACQQTMKESLGIFMFESEIHLHVINCDGAFESHTNASMHRLFVVAEAFGVTNSCRGRGLLTQYELHGRQTIWSDLKKWARVAHGSPLTHALAKRAPIPLGDATWDSIMSVICTAVKLQRLPWKEVEEILEHMRITISIHNIQWYQD